MTASVLQFPRVPREQPRVEKLGTIMWFVKSTYLWTAGPTREDALRAWHRLSGRAA